LLEAVDGGGIYNGKQQLHILKPTQIHTNKNPNVCQP
jgi:hypothetical protein